MNKPDLLDEDVGRCWTSLLFVPGHREGAIARASSTGADMICIDLEDGIPASAKAAARGRVAELLASGALAGQAVRINALGTRDGLADLLMLAAAPRRPSLLVLPKVDGVDGVAIATAVLDDPSVAMLPMIESAEGLANAFKIARHPRCAGLMLGGADLASEIGAEFGWDTLALARQSLVLACTRAARPAYDMPFLGLDDPAGLAAEARRARALGFVGKAAIHPAQVATIDAVFRPSAGDLDLARRAVAAFERSGGGAQRLGGAMIDEAVVRGQRALLRAAVGGAHG